MSLPHVAFAYLFFRFCFVISMWFQNLGCHPHSASTNHSTPEVYPRPLFSLHFFIVFLNFFFNCKDIPWIFSFQAASLYDPRTLTDKRSLAATEYRICVSLNTSNIRLFERSHYLCKTRPKLSTKSLGTHSKGGSDVREKLLPTVMKGMRKLSDEE